MSTKTFRQLTPYETSLYFFFEAERARIQDVQMRTIYAQTTEKKNMLYGGLALIIISSLMIMSILLSPVFSSAPLYLLLSIPEIIVFMVSTKKGSRKGCLTTYAFIFISFAILDAINSKEYTIIVYSLFAAFILVHLYPAYIGYRLFSVGRAMEPMKIEDIPQIIPPTDEEFDAWVENRVRECLVRTIHRLGLEDEIINHRQLLRVRGYVLPGMRDARHYRSQDLQSKLGMDGRWRYSINIYTYFYPAEHQIMVFTYDINAMNWDDYRETTKEYFYQDIIGATTEDDNDTLYFNGEPHSYRTQRFSLRLCDGTAVWATVRSRPLDTMVDLPTFDIPHSGIDTTIAQLRMLLRTKKA